jgi:autotransporter translocation and assembly factor TamB
MDLNLKGSLSKPVYSGTLTIPRARIDLDALQGNQSAKVDVNEPLLAQAMQKYETQITEPENEKKPPPSFVENLTGKMRILIPRNTWIKNKDLNVEIGGDIEIIKTGKDFELFGFVKTIRGNYTLYGRKFDLRDGVVTFQGGKEINPLLDITIKHIFRDINKQKRELAIALSGEASQPAIKFYLDSEELSEADAISYLLFGRSSDQISQGERSEVAGQSEASLAKSLIAKQIGGQIASEIGKKLKLDVIEFSGGDNWKQASILVGKYITNDLFLSYQKEFSLGQSKELVADKVSLEYEINKFLSLQATRGDEKSTGIDLFWKYQKK